MSAPDWVETGRPSPGLGANGKPAWSSFLDPGDPIRWWPLNEASGSTAMDESPAQDPLVPGFGTPVLGQPGPTASRRSVDTSGGSLFSTSAIALAAPLTAAVWVYPTAYSGAEHAAFTQQYSSYMAWTFGWGGQWGTVGDRIWFSPYDGGTYYFTYGPNPTPLNVWSHYAGTMDTTGALVLYENAVQIATGAGPANFSPPASRAFLGGGWYYTDAVFPGRLSGARIYDKALSAAQIASLYQSELEAAKKWLPLGKVA